MPRRSTPNPLAKGIGARIVQLRREQGLTAEKLAYESEVGSKGYVSDIEHGLALPSLTTLECIAQRLNVSLYDLLVFPEAGAREQLIDRTRHLPKGPLQRLVKELEQANVTAPWVPPRLHKIRAYAALEVAAGWSSEAAPRAELGTELVRLPGTFQRTRDFAVRAAGHSLQGFRSTIRSGDWLVMRKALVEPEAALGQVALIAHEDARGDKSLHVKRVVKKGRRVLLSADDRDVKAQAAAENDHVLALLVSVIHPESLAPAPRSRFAKRRLATLFGLTREPEGTWSRVDGHLFIVLKPSDVRPKAPLPVDCTPRPAETAYVLTIESGRIEYLGVARYDAQRSWWKLDDSSTK